MGNHTRGRGKSRAIKALATDTWSSSQSIGIEYSLKVQKLRGLSSELAQRRIEQNAPTGET
jgi:hypothetical protein